MPGHMGAGGGMPDQRSSGLKPPLSYEDRESAGLRLVPQLPPVREALKVVLPVQLSVPPEEDKGSASETDDGREERTDAQPTGIAAPPFGEGGRGFIWRLGLAEEPGGSQEPPPAEDSSSPAEALAA